MIKLKTFKDGSYIPITNPLSRRYDYESDWAKKNKVTRYKKGIGEKMVDFIFNNSTILGNTGSWLKNKDK